MAKMQENGTTITRKKIRRVIYVNGPIIVGAGPSGLAVAACLKEQHAIPSLILERSSCIASLWKHKTYDRVKLHLPKKFCELPLMGFPENYPKYPSKAQFITYLESYARHFDLCPRFNHSVVCAFLDEQLKLWRVRVRVRVGVAAKASNGNGNDDNDDDDDDNECVEYVSKWVIVATGENAEAKIPSEITGIDKFQGKMVHTSLYKSGSGFAGQRVLVIGCGNSGMEVSLDLCKYNALPHMVVRNSVHVLPREMFGLSTFGVAMALLKWFPLRLVDKILLLVANITLGNTDEIGLRRPKTGPLELKNATGKTPVLDVGALSLIRSGHIKVMEGVKEITKNGAKFVDGQLREFDSIILATGYKSNVPSWLKDCDFFSDDGMPKVPFPNGWRGGKGLYTVGFTRRGLLGTSSDAINVAKDISEQCRSQKSNHEILNSWTSSQ